MSDNDKNTHSGHRMRMRSRFISERSLDSFQEHNVLEMLLFYSIPRGDTNELAHSLIKKYGSLKGVFDAPYESLTDTDGIGENSAVLIKLIPELSKMYSKKCVENIKKICSAEDAASLLRPLYIGLHEEKLTVVGLDNKGNILNTEMFGGSCAESTDINERRIVQMLMNCHATAAIFAHNHPNGICVPSKNDHLTTKKLASILSVLDIKLIDHLILSESDCFSFAGNPVFSDCINISDDTAYEYLSREKKK